jgi:CBS domain-containing protein
MVKNKFGNIPVVNEHNYLKGMISDTNLMRVLF